MDKNGLIRALITKIVEEKKIPELKYPQEFYEDNARLIQKILERKSDLPTREYLEKYYKFNPEDTEMSAKDIQERLDRIYFQESASQLIKKFANESRGTEKVIDLLRYLQKGFNGISGVLTPNYVCDVTTDKEKIMEELRSQRSTNNFVKTGFTIMDDVVAPKKGDLLMVCGPTKRGKTTTMLKMMFESMANGNPSIYFSLEMDIIEITNRIITHFGDHKFSDLKFNRISEDEYEAALDKVSEEYPTPTKIVTRGNESTINLATIEKYIQDHEPDAVYLDYLTLLDDVGYDWNADSPTKQLKRMAQQYRCLIVIGVQADSATMASDDIPGPSNVFGNKTWVRDVNHFLGVTMVRKQTDESNKDSEVKLVLMYKVGASRDGRLPSFTYLLKPERSIWEDVTAEYEMGVI